MSLQKSMKVFSYLFVLMVLCTVLATTPKECITSAFEASCKQQLYACFNDSTCSYQLHENTKHIFLTDSDTKVPKMYFSDPKAVELHRCLDSVCEIGGIDEGYPSTLPLDYCIMEVWDICQGNPENVYQGHESDEIMQCYQKYCKDLPGQQLVSL